LKISEERIAKIEGTLDQMDKRLNHIETELLGFRNEISSVKDEILGIRTEISSHFRWTVGLVLGMWTTVMMTLIPILLKILGII